MYAMFCDAYKFNQPIENWDIKRVKRTSRMFFGARLFNQNITSWDFDNVTDFEDMFHNSHKDMIDQYSVKLNSFNPKEIKDQTLSFHIPFFNCVLSEQIILKKVNDNYQRDDISELLFFFNGCVLGEFKVPKKLKIHIDIDKYKTEVQQFIFSPDSDSIILDIDCEVFFKIKTSINDAIRAIKKFQKSKGDLRWNTAIYIKGSSFNEKYLFDGWDDEIINETIEENPEWYK
jgi:hypothetical protein